MFGALFFILLLAPVSCDICEECKCYESGGRVTAVCGATGSLASLEGVQRLFCSLPVQWTCTQLQSVGEALIWCDSEAMDLLRECEEYQPPPSAWIRGERLNSLATQTSAPKFSPLIPLFTHPPTSISVTQASRRPTLSQGPVGSSVFQPPSTRPSPDTSPPSRMSTLVTPPSSLPSFPSNLPLPPPFTPSPPPPPSTHRFSPTPSTLPVSPHLFQSLSTSPTTLSQSIPTHSSLPPLTAAHAPITTPSHTPSPPYRPSSSPSTAPITTPSPTHPPSPSPRPSSPPTATPVAVPNSPSTVPPLQPTRLPTRPYFPSLSLRRSSLPPWSIRPPLMSPATPPTNITPLPSTLQDTSPHPSFPSTSSRRPSLPPWSSTQPASLPSPTNPPSLPTTPRLTTRRSSLPLSPTTNHPLTFATPSTVSSPPPTESLLSLTPSSTHPSLIPTPTISANLSTLSNASLFSPPTAVYHTFWSHGLAFMEEYAIPLSAAAGVFCGLTLLFIVYKAIKHYRHSRSHKVPLPLTRDGEEEIELRSFEMGERRIPPPLLDLGQDATPPFLSPLLTSTPGLSPSSPPSILAVSAEVHQDETIFFDVAL